MVNFDWSTGRSFDGTGASGFGLGLQEVDHSIWRLPVLEKITVRLYACNCAILWFELAKVPPGSPVWNIDVLNQRILAQKKVCISITIGPGRQCPLKYMKALIMTLDITLSMYQGYNAIITICLICLTCLICRASSSGSQWTMRCWEVVMAIGLPASPKTFPLRLTIISKSFSCM